MLTVFKFHKKPYKDFQNKFTQKRFVIKMLFFDILPV